MKEKEAGDDGVTSSNALTTSAQGGSSAVVSGASGGAPIDLLVGTLHNDTGPASGTSTPLASSSTGGTSGSLIARRARELEEPEVNPEHLQQLMDMGFSRESATEALLHTTSLEHATDYLLTCPSPMARATQGLLPDLDLSEEDQMLRAIAMSLGENVMASTDSKGPDDRVTASNTDVELEPERERQVEEEPLSAQVLTDFTNRMLPGFFNLLDALPDCVYRLCDLLVAVVQRNGDAWRDEALQLLVDKISSDAAALLRATAPLVSEDSKTLSEWAAHLGSSPEASRAAACIHLLTLLFEETRFPCARFTEAGGLLDLLVRLLEAVPNCLSAASWDNGVPEPVPTPKWLAPLILLIDLYEKVASASRHRIATAKATSHVWKWFDDRSGRWCLYNAGNNRAIDEAYEAGEPNVRFTAGRRRYTVQFATMVQINEETGNRRPIMLALRGKEKREVEVYEDSSASAGESAPSRMEVDDQQVGSNDTKEDSHEIEGLSLEQAATVVRACTGLIEIPVDATTLHAVMRLCLRLTRRHELALIFAELGGPRLLLRLTQASDFQGFASLATLLIRHVMEEPRTLAHTMEKVIRSTACSSNGSVGSKELHYLLRVLAPAACRNPQVFVDVTCSILRVALPAPSKRGNVIHI